MNQYVNVPGSLPGDQVAGIGGSLTRTIEARLRDESVRADAAKAPDAAALVATSWARERADSIARETRGNADAIRARILGAHRRDATAGRRADAASYYAMDLAANLPGSPIVRPRADLSDLLVAIPTRNVAAGAATWRRRFVTHQGAAGVYRPGSTQPPIASISRDEGQGEIVTYWTCVVDEWLEQLHDGFSGLDNAGEKAAAATRALEELAHTAILSGIPGLGISSLQDLPMSRRASSLVYGTAAIDDVLKDLASHLDAAVEAAKGTSRPDSIIVSERIMNRLNRYANFANGGSQYASQIVSSLFTDRGITKVVPGFSLQDFGGSNVDAMIAFSSSETSGLANVLAMRPAPVRTVETIGGRATVYAMRHGGLELPIATSALLVEIEVAP
jgi:hypothetical protein